jgi:predicted helicase
MRPKPFQNGDWLNLREAFIFSKSGMKSGNDDVFVSTMGSRLRDQVVPFLAKLTANRDYDASLEINYAYRPLDLRWYYRDMRLLNRPGPMMQRVWGSNNVGLYAMPFGTGAGPTVWCHALVPDYHAFSGRGGYAFPLHDRRPEFDRSNVSPQLIQSLSVGYGEPVTAEEIFDAILCLLSATSYSLRFAEDLEDVFPHIPFASRREVFMDAVRVGREIRAVETFARPPSEIYRRVDFARIASEPRDMVAPVEYSDGSITLCRDRSGRITGLPQTVWDFSVSGYRLLPRWLEARIGLRADLNFVRELRDICGRIAELVDLFDRADIVLAATLHETMTREALGFPADPRA